MAVLVEGEAVQGGFSRIDNNVVCPTVCQGACFSCMPHIMDRPPLYRQDKQTKARGLKLHSKGCLMVTV